ncbi:MAG: Valine--tRNA ligase [Flavobacterium sp. SCGC AAA160-P02]|nr:MAG: Valine--tRNA ligase [Flavobacterium sp. SCGC AAA160-P02]
MSINIPSVYDASLVESKWYDYWMKHNYFHSEVDEREPYTIVIPPPNVTGLLHMGHMLNNTIQDVLIRRARLQGKNACWVPGTDHASIATEAKVVAKLKEHGIDKNDLTRDEFLAHAWEWKHEYGGIILEQLKKLGASCDWERTAFTMDPEMSESVIKVFVDLFNKGLIYRGYRMVHWDPEAKTTLSDEEVIYEERQGNLYYLNYAIENSDETVSIATTRPETIFGDTAICINPNDPRFLHLKGKKAIVPLCNRVIPIIEDDYVDIEFGTGCLKVTPAHDENDKVLGDKHALKVIDIFNEDASLNSFGLHYKGKDRFVVRKEIAKELKDKGFLIKIEQYTNKVGTSERTKAVIEPRLSDQWFLKMEDLAKPALDAVLGENRDVKLFPRKFENIYRHWMENIRDWNISRQLMWGQQIPAYFYGDGKEDFVVAVNRIDALDLAKTKTGNSSLVATDLRQESDVVDTWFSSWLWPISVFDGIRNPNNKEINYYYPTNDLVTGPDILFFWVARMIISGYEYKGEKPFQNVYFTGLVRDKQRRKMSKQLGNSPDALKLIDKYGADGVRVGLLLSSAAGNDLMFDEDLCQQGKQFANKIWNAFRLIKGWQIDDKLTQPKTAKMGLLWYEATFQKTLLDIEDHFSKYRLSDALMAIYKLIMDDFSSWLLEIIKPAYQQPIDKKTFDAIIEILENNLKILHPFMPFLTEEIWQYIVKRAPKEALIISKYPAQKEYNSSIILSFDFASQIISGIRTIRKEKNIPFRDEVKLFFVNNENYTNEFNEIIQKLTNTSQVIEVTDKVEGASFRVNSNEYFVPISIENIDIEGEIIKLELELERAQSFLFGIQKKLSNDRFISNAPDKVIALERKKESDTIAKINTIKSRLESLR